jgi:hypothetical protein
MSFLEDNCVLNRLSSLDELAGFSCGGFDLDDFFQNDCLDYSKQLLGKTYYYRLENIPSEVVCAFTLANASIRVDDLPNARRKKIQADIPHVKTLKDYPAVLVGRLGVSIKYHSQHIGSEVLTNLKYWFLDEESRTGCRFMIVDAYNHPETLSFYTRNGFKTVFSSDLQEKEYRHLSKDINLTTRLMYFDLLSIIEL